MGVRNYLGRGKAVYIGMEVWLENRGAQRSWVRLLGRWKDWQRLLHEGPGQQRWHAVSWIREMQNCGTVSPAEVCLQACHLQSILPDAARVLFLNLRFEHMALQTERTISSNPCRINFKPLSMAFKALRILPGFCPCYHSCATESSSPIPAALFLQLYSQSLRKRLGMDGDQVIYIPTPQLPGSRAGETSIAIFQASMKRKPLFPYPKCKWWLTFPGTSEVESSTILCWFCRYFYYLFPICLYKWIKTYYLHLIYIEYYR